MLLSPVPFVQGIVTINLLGVYVQHILGLAGFGNSKGEKYRVGGQFNLVWRVECLRLGLRD